MNPEIGRIARYVQAVYHRLGPLIGETFAADYVITRLPTILEGLEKDMSENLLSTILAQDWKENRP